MKQILIASALALLWSASAAMAGDTRDLMRTQNNFTPPPAKDGFQYPDCFCTDSQGKRVEMGQTACLQIGSSQVLARCGMSLNNPAWRQLSGGCPTS